MKVTLDGQPVSSFRYNQVRALLAYLAVEYGAPHRRDVLAGLIWPDQPQKTALDNLRNALATLRRAIGDNLARPSHFFVANDNIQFNSASDHQLDVSAFIQLLATCTSHPHRRLESCPSCKERLEQAVELYQGAFLDGFILPDSDLFEDWVCIKRERFSLMALEALQKLVAIYEYHGELDRALIYARRQLELDPCREQAHVQVIKILASQNMRSEACAQYEKCRSILMDELGVEPAEETTHLYEQVKYGLFQASLSLDKKLNNLPPNLTSFVGRVRELKEIKALLDDPACRLLTLLGPGGVGKTRLAIAIARQLVDTFPHGAAFVSLASVNSTELIAPTILDAFNIGPSSRGDLRAQLINYLADKELILVLDNFEHLTEGAGLVTEILEKAPGVLVLVTSRQRLSLQSEWLFEVNGLSYPSSNNLNDLISYDAVQLFTQRMHQVKPKLTLFSEDLSGITRICQLAEGLPLGIELAASAVRLHSIEKVAEAIESGKDDLAVSYKDMPDRHRSIRAVFEHSYHLLSPPEQSAFCRLAIFRGGFTADAAFQVAEATTDILSSLKEHSLVRYDPEKERYDLHELVRQYALEKLRKQGIEHALQERHLKYFTDIAEKADAYHVETGHTEHFGLLNPEVENFRAAIDFCFTYNPMDQALKLAGALGFYWGSTLGYLQEADGWIMAILQSGESFPRDQLYARLLMRASRLAQIRDIGIGLQLSEQALILWQELGDQLQVALTLADIGRLRMRLGDLEKAKEKLDDSLQILFQLDNQVHTANVLLLMGIYYHTIDSQNNLEQIRSVFEKSLIISRKYGLDLMAARAIGNLGNIEMGLGNFTQALPMLEECLKIIKDKDNPELLHWMFLSLGYVNIHLQNYSVARSYLEDCVKIGYKRGNVSLDGLACICYLDQRQGLIDQALFYFKEVFRQIYSTHNVSYPLESLERMIGVLIQCGEPERAAILFAFTHATREDLRVSMTLYEQTEYEHVLAETKAQLGEAAFARAWAEGRSMTLEQAKACAMEAKVQVQPKD